MSNQIIETYSDSIGVTPNRGSKMSFAKMTEVRDGVESPLDICCVGLEVMWGRLGI